MSSKRQGLASKLLTVLGGAGLAISICAPRASAQATIPPPWTVANYANRYVCNVASTTSAVPPSAKQHFFTGVMLLNPTGNGTYQGGSLLASLTPFTGVAPTGAAPANFCSYSLNPNGSGYTVNQDGTGVEILTWLPSGTPIPGCPNASFIMVDSIVLRNNTTANNTVPRTDFTTDNFLGLHSATVEDPGHGYCLK